MLVKSIDCNEKGIVLIRAVDKKNICESMRKLGYFIKDNLNCHIINLVISGGDVKKNVVEILKSLGPFLSQK